MHYSDFKELKAKIFFLALLTIAGTILAFSFSLALLKATNAEEQSMPIVLLAQGLSTFFIFILPSIFYIRKFNLLKGLENFNLNFVTVFIVLLLIIFVRPLVAWIDSLFTTDLDYFKDIIESFRLIAQELNEKVVKLAYSETIPQLLSRILVIALLPAIGEELFFRYILQNLLKDISGRIHLSVFLSSLIFALIHLNIINFVAIFLLGLCLGYIYEYTKNIIYPIIAHFVNNGSLVILMYQNKDINYALSEEVSLPTLLISITLTVVSIILLLNLKRIESL